MRRVVEPELLDELPAADPRAVRSRADLRRLNCIMGHAGILSRALLQQFARSSLGLRPLRLVELGAGDGTLMLRLARRWSALGLTGQVTLLDRQSLVAVSTRRAFAALGWSLETVETDVLAWLRGSSLPVDLVLANLFLHHFPDQPLATLLQLVAARTNLFIACEPRRSTLALTAARWLRLLGCNEITRHDAPVSVRAGFCGQELSALWPSAPKFELREQPAGFFSHCFAGKRHA